MVLVWPSHTSVALCSGISTHYCTLPPGQVPASRKAWLKARLVNGLISVLAGILLWSGSISINLRPIIVLIDVGTTVLASMAL